MRIVVKYNIVKLYNPVDVHCTDFNLTNLDAKINNCHVSIIEQVENICLSEVQFLELNVMNCCVGDGATCKFNIFIGSLSCTLMLKQNKIYTFFN